jgi:integrase/recombinase XerD
MELLRFRNEYVKTVSISTATNRIILIKNFFKYLHKFNYRGDNPSELLNLPKGEKKANNTYELISNETYKEIYSDISIPFSTRLAILLGSQMGLRISEVCNLKKEDIFEDYIVVRMSKGNKTREVPCTQLVMEFIKQQLRRNPNGEYLLINRNGDKFSEDAIRKSFNKVRESYQLGSDICFHSNRHAYGSVLANSKDTSISVISMLMGHENIKTTQLYLHKNKEEAKKQIANVFNNF